MKLLPPHLTALMLVFFFGVGHTNAQSITSSKICPFGCDLVPVPELPKSGATSTARTQYIQDHSTNRLPVTPESTSTDLYCESMALAFVESVLNYQPPSSPEHAKRVDATQAELLIECKSMPTIGGNEKKQKNMTSQELAQIACLGTAEGVATAQASKTEDRLLYSKLTQNRQFFVKACATNRKLFLSDMKKYGPYHVLSKSY